MQFDFVSPCAELHRLVDVVPFLDVLAEAFNLLAVTYVTCNNASPTIVEGSFVVCPGAGVVEAVVVIQALWKHAKIRGGQSCHATSLNSHASASVVRATL